MSGYYRKFCKNFSSVCKPLTHLLSKHKQFVWDLECQGAFHTIKGLLIFSPILMMLDLKSLFCLLWTPMMTVLALYFFKKIRKIYIEHLISYFSCKFDKYQRNYSTCRKPLHYIVLALQHFDFYLTAALFPIQVYTDHNPFVFLAKMKNKNQCLQQWSLALRAHS